MKKIQFALVFVIVTSLLAACATTPTDAPAVSEMQAPETPESPAPIGVTAAPELITITDTLDRTIEFEKYPTRILIVGKAAFMLLDAAFLFPEAPERLIGYELRSQTGLDFIRTAFPQTSNLTVLDMDAGPEQIAPLNPDLVMMKSYLKEQLGDQVEQLGIKVVYLDLETPEKISRDIQTLGQVFGNKERADQLVQLYDIAASRITDVTATISEENKPSVLLLMYSDKGGEIAFSVPPMNYLQSLLVEMAGGKTVWKDSPTEGWTVVTLEQIAAWNPDIIMVIDYKGKALEAVNTLKQDANWQLFSAVQNGKLYAFPVDFQSWDQPDTRWTLGLTWMATKIQPELFSAIKMYNEIPAFYADFYNLSNAEYKEKILPILRGDF